MATRFSAVRTTGIYCRDGCPASPNVENVVAYDFAAAAEADGFRPCLRCRPYQAPEPAEWLGSSALVCRAVRMILGGALDDGSEADLAGRLGVSGRHLRRLFVDQVGATPDEVARSRRAHFARRLLDETDFPIAQIAHAAGFGSVRQMNRQMHRVFRASPSELRSKRRRTDRLIADGGLPLRLTFRGPLDWAAVLAHLAPRATPGVESLDDGVYRRTISVDGHPGAIEVHPGGADHLVLTAHLPRWEGLIHVAGRVRRAFDLDADLDAVVQTLGDDADLGPSLRRQPGVRLIGGWDPFEVAVRVILGQQVSVAGATMLAGRLVERLGQAVPGLEAWGLSHTFPAAARLADTDLRSIGLPASRARAINALSAAYLEDRVRLDGSIGLDELTASLETLPGIGPWTSQMIALRACSEPDAIPAGDLGLRRALGNGQPLPAKVVEARAESWRPWRSYAAAHLWAG